jgi:hypothetical protein
MHNFQITSAFTSMSRKVLASAAIGAAAVAFIGATPAHADIKQGNGAAAGCPIENNGKTETVPVGTRIGLFTCGEDGEWHFGWVITSISGAKVKANPSTGGALHTVGAPVQGVLRVARGAR